MAPSTLQVYKYTGYTVYNLMYILVLHLIGCCCFSSRIPERLCNQAVLRLWEFVVWMFSLGQSWWLWCWQRVTWHWSMDEFTQNTPDDRHTHTKYPKLFHSAIDIQVFRLYDARHCKPVCFLCLSLQVSCWNQLLEPFTFGRKKRGPLRFGPMKLAIAKDGTLQESMSRLCHVSLGFGWWLAACAPHNCGGTDLEICHLASCTRGGNPNMWVCYYVRSTFLAQICVCYILLMYIFGRITSNLQFFFATCSITEVNSLESAKSPMNSTLQQPGPPVGLLRGHSLPQKLRWSKLNSMEVWFRFDFPVKKTGDWLMFHVSFFLGG